METRRDIIINDDIRYTRTELRIYSIRCWFEDLLGTYAYKGPEDVIIHNTRIKIHAYCITAWFEDVEFYYSGFLCIL